jgi:Peptidase of plants and bacteria
MRRQRLQAWAEELYATYGRQIADLIGVDEAPPIRVTVASTGAGAAWTNGTEVTLSARWFAQHPDDVGGCLHEFTHAIMRAPVYDGTTQWLIEGIADWVRDELGHDMPWTYAHFEPGAAAAGYQTTAHFLRWLETRTPGAVKALSAHLIAGTYDPEVFQPIAGRTLEQCVSDYEAEVTTP